MRRIMLTCIAAMLAVAPARAQTTEALLDTLQHTSFQYFWDQANTTTGLIKDRSTSGSACSIAAEGFGLTALCIGVDHGWVSRTAARDRVVTALTTFWTAPQDTTHGDNWTIGYKGFFYHFLGMGSARRVGFSELSTIDTALLLAGVLYAKQYFDGPDPVEGQIRALADSIYYRVDWQWAQNGRQGLMMGWKPEDGEKFAHFGEWVGYNEAMIMYLLALGSPTHPVSPNAWRKWTSTYSWQTWYGQSFFVCPPLFTHQYSHCWIDFRGLPDSITAARGTDYFENSRRATLAQRSYSMLPAQAAFGYSDSLWGLTACDGPPPNGYRAHGAPPNQNDDGTIAPTAATSSIVFTPNESMAVMWRLWNNYRSGPLWGAYGFRDAFNLFRNPDWYATDYLGIDQGPIIVMIENYRNESIWSRFMQNPDVLHGLANAGFTGPALGVPTAPRPGPALALWSTPNPFVGAARVHFRLLAAGPVRVSVFDLAGREVAMLADDVFTAGEHSVTFSGAGLRSGVYHLRLRSGNTTVHQRCVLVH